MFKIICQCGNQIELKPKDGEELNEERDSYYASSSVLSITLWQEHDVVGISCDKCKASIYTFV